MNTQLVYTHAAGFVQAAFVNPQPDTLVPLCADNADFRDANDRVTLAGLGVFSIDKACHRASRALQRRLEAQLDEDYAYLGLDRKRCYRDIARFVQRDGLVPDGCWVTSSGAFVSRRNGSDNYVRERARELRAEQVALVGVF